MPAIAWHITSHLSLDRLLTSSTMSRREAARTLLELPPRYGLLAFSIPDNHLHLLLQCDRRTAGKGANKAEGALVKRLALPVGFDGARFTPVETQGHLRNAFHYIHRQDAHHESRGDPLQEATSLWDLLGLRAVDPSLPRRVGTALPRLRRRDLLPHLPVQRLDHGRAGLHLSEAVGAVVARSTPRGDDLRLARAAAFQLALADGFAPSAARDLLELPRRTATRLQGLSVPTALDNALRLQLGLREALARPVQAAA